MLAIIIYIILGISSCTLLGYYFFMFNRLKETDVQGKGSTSSVSVVVCARNEIENLKQNLPLLLTQEHPSYEVIVVNDASWDGTGEYLSEKMVETPLLKMVEIKEEHKRTHGKKMALTLGIKKAQYNRLLLTDADCRPSSSKWIEKMTDSDSAIVLGYSGYQKQAGLLNLIVRYDTWRTAIFYMSAAAIGKAYMGVGRNLSYTKSLYEENGGFRNHYHLMGGDDDLFVNENSTRANTSFTLDPGAFTMSSSPKNLRTWSKQKRRHLSVGHRYRRGSKFLIGTYSAGLLLFYLSIVIGLSLNIHWRVLLGAYLIKTLIHLLISIYPSRVLKEREMVALLPILEPVMLILDVLFGLSVMVNRPKAWK